MKAAKFLGALATFWLLFLPSAALPQCGGDYGSPDSAYYLDAYYLPEDCSGHIKAIVPIYHFSDATSLISTFRIYWSGCAAYDTVFFRGRWGMDTAKIEMVSVDSVNRSVLAGVADSLDGGIRPGAEVVAELVFHTQLKDSFTLSCATDPQECFSLMHLLGIWPVCYRDLDRVFVTPDTLAMMPGDADCSGSVDISDVVYLIVYIFGGGSPPYDLNSADVDQSCAVDISDAVYLITYIFGGGPPPLPGCVY